MITELGHIAARMRWGVRRIPWTAWARFSLLLIDRAFGERGTPTLNRERVRRVIFVCQGNIMRSAFAAAFWDQCVQPFGREIAVVALSAGTDAKPGRGADPTAIAAADNLEVSLASHRAMPLSQLTFSASDLIVAFDCENEAVIRGRIGNDAGTQTLLLGDLDVDARGLEVEVRDPWGKAPDEVVKTFARISNLVALLSERLAGGSATADARFKKPSE